MFTTALALLFVVKSFKRFGFSYICHLKICFIFYLLLIMDIADLLVMMDVAESKAIKNFTLLNKASLFFNKLNKIAMQFVPKPLSNNK